MKSEEITRLAKFLAELAAATESGRKFRVEFRSPEQEWQTKPLPGGGFRVGTEYRVVFEAREFWENVYPHTTSQHRTFSDAVRCGDSSLVELVHYREVLDEA